MLPNPEVGVPYILAYDKFNKAIKELEELKNEELNSDTISENDTAKEKSEKQNRFQIVFAILLAIKIGIVAFQHCCIKYPIQS